VELAASGRDLATPHVFFAPLAKAPNPQAFRLRALHKLRGLTALDWIVQFAGQSPLPDGLLAFARERPISLIHVNHLYTLGFARRLRAHLGRAGNAVPIILETHDAQAEILHQRKEPNPWSGRPDPIERLRSAEIALLRDQAVLVHCSVDDRTYFACELPHASHLLVRPTIDPAFVAAVRDGAAAPGLPPIDVLFVGTGHNANREAILWLLTEVWPHVEHRGWHLKIVGGIDELVGRTSPELYARFQSCFTGRAADLVPYYRAARCVIAPMRSGAGTSVKTIEAFALAIPFVGTSKAYRGFPHEVLAQSGIEAFDDPRAFAGAMADAIAGKDQSAAKGAAVYRQLFSRDTCYAGRDEGIRLAVERSRSADPGFRAERAWSRLKWR
jgi:hypothetical protein